MLKGFSILSYTQIVCRIVQVIQNKPPHLATKNGRFALVSTYMWAIIYRSDTLGTQNNFSM